MENQKGRSRKKQTNTLVKGAEVSVAEERRHIKDIRLNKSTVIIIIAAVIVVGILLAMFAYKGVTEYKFKSDAYYTVMGSSVDVPAGTVAKTNKEGDVTLNGENGEPVPAEAGIYFKGGAEMITIKPVIYYKSGQTDRLQGKQVLPLTVVKCGYGMTVLEKDKKSLEEPGCFLFDGEDTYIALRDAQLFVGDEKIADLSPLSYVVSSYTNWVAYWDHDTKQYGEIDFDQDEYREVKLYFADDDLSIICDRDRAESKYDNFMLTSAVTMLEKALK